ncbi:MAG: hypothetical protein AAF518_14770 [Spirochaetota bacterium]
MEATLEEKLEQLPQAMQQEVSNLLDILIYTSSEEKEAEENHLLAMPLVEFILTTNDSRLLNKLETTIQEELDKQMTPWEKQELEKTMENFSTDDCIPHEEVMAEMEEKYGF